MSLQFQALPQVEFPDEVKNAFCLKVIVQLSLHLCFIFMSAVVYNLVPFIFIFNQYLILVFGLFSLVMSTYTPACRTNLIFIYLFSIAYFLAYTFPYYYLEYAIVSVLFSYLVCGIILHCKDKTNVPILCLGVFSNVTSVVMNTLTLFVYQSPNILFIVIVDCCIVLYLSIVFFFLNRTMSIFTPTQFVNAFQYITSGWLYFFRRIEPH